MGIVRSSGGGVPVDGVWFCCCWWSVEGGVQAAIDNLAAGLVRYEATPTIRGCLHRELVVVR